MPWIESHTELSHHPKVYRLAACLGVSRVYAVGLLHCLWHWVMTYAPNGRLDGITSAEVSRAVDWDGDPDALVEGLVATRWLDRAGDGSLSVHDWDQYAGRWLRQRQASLERQQRHRERHAPVTRDNSVTSQACHGDVTLLPNQTIPNQTIPNQTRPNQTSSQSSAKRTREGSGSVEGDARGINAMTAARSGPSPPLRQHALTVTWDELTGFAVPDDLLRLWAAANPAVDVPTEILRAHAWAVANPAKRKRDWRRFLTNWMAREQERGGSHRGRRTPATTEETLEERAARHARDLRAMRATGRLLAPLERSDGTSPGERGPPAGMWAPVPFWHVTGGESHDRGVPGGSHQPD